MTTRQGGRRREGRRFFPRRKVCSFCVDKIQAISYKDSQRLRRYISDWGKIESRRKTGTCAPHQRMLATAIKRSRYVALLPYTGSHSQFDLSYRDGPRADRFRRERDRRDSEPVVSTPPKIQENLIVPEAPVDFSGDEVQSTEENTDEATGSLEESNDEVQSTEENTSEATGSLEESNDEVEEDTPTDSDAEES